MILRARQLIGSRVRARGRVTRIAVAPAPFAVLAFSVRERWWRPVAWYSLAAVADVAAGSVQLRDRTPRRSRTELAGALELTGVPVRTVSGVSLGRVVDFTFTVPAGEILDVAATSRVVGEVVVARSAVVSAAPDVVLVRDAAVPAGVPVILGNP